MTPFYNFFFNTYQIQCKECGFLCRELFGLELAIGTGDYGHLTVEHSPMLMRLFKSLARYSNQGFEAAHKVTDSYMSIAQIMIPLHLSHQVGI